MNNSQDLNWEVISKNILIQKQKNKSITVYYVGLYKQSQTGLLYNERMLVIQDKNFTIFYTKYFKSWPMLQDMQKKGATAIKQTFCIANSSILKQQNLVTINFVNGNYDKKKWIFKFNSNKLADKWIHLYHELQEKCVSRSIKSKQTKSTGFVSQYSSILSNLKFVDSIYEEKVEQDEENQYQSENAIKKKKINIKTIQEKGQF